MRGTTADAEHLVHLVAEAVERPHHEVRQMLASEDHGETHGRSSP